MSFAQTMNGYKPASTDQNAQVVFYDQWLQLKDAVLADRHPHFKLPPSVKERFQPVSFPAQPILTGSLSQLPGLSNSLNGTHAPSGVQKNSAAGQANAQAYAQNATTTEQNSASKSGINPVLLTKSDDLIRAEIQLKRQRIERQLKEAVDQRKHVTRARDNEEAAPLAALTEILQKALEIVKPVSGLVSPANVQTAASDSFDENSYYSSQANDWSSEEGTPNSRQEEAAAATSQKPTVPASSASVLKSHPSQIEHLVEQPHPTSPKYHEPSYAYANDSEAVYDAEREDSEEYSPPAADAFSGPDGDGDGDAMDLDDDSSEFVPQDAEVPSPQVPFIPNHLTQLAAPQPARVSPLTITKVPGLGQHSAAVEQRPASPRIQQHVNTYHSQLVSDDSITSPRGSAGPSPAGSHKKKQRNKNKKRKREAEVTTKARKPRNRPAVSSPEPYIKPEPVSPPPMTGFSNLQSARVRPYQQPPPDVEVVAPPRQVYYQEAPPPQPSKYGYEGVSSPNVVTMTSPAAYPRPRKDDQDLRRVASMHAAQQPISPAGRAYSPAGYRTVSQPHVGGQPRYQDEYSRPPQPRYVRSERSMSPPQIQMARDPYVQTMAPPPPPIMTVVTDQYGNRYYANEPQAQPQPQQMARMSVAPQARPEQDTMYERAPSRQSVAYAPRAQGMYQDESSMMPPPPPARRVAEYPEAVPVDYRMYRQREISRAPDPQHFREEVAPLYIRDAPNVRASVRPSDPAASGPYARAYSVRPEMEPVRYMSRQPSMAPQAEYVRMVDAGMRALPPPPPPMRAVSVMPAVSEYGRAPEVRYGYGQPAAQYAPVAGTRYVEEEGMRGTAGPREVFVDQYGREVTRVGY